MLALFDLDNTLIDRRRCLDEWARGFVGSRCMPREQAAVISDELRERAYPVDFARLRETLGLSDTPGDLWQEYVAGIARSVRCFPGVLEGLEELRSLGWSTGIATNGAADIQRAKLAATGLAPLFDGVCVSEEIGARKPAPRHFEVAAAMCGGRSTAGGWMVGDNPGTDMEGGRTAGLRTLWVTHGRPWIYGPRKPDMVVRDVAEAINALRELTD
ncbi:HAD family hydrolase [Streptomyces sp. NPDC059881]|uniref:HAD family hydrolase n=1 Tax=Streptomyces sp. NPDC059881 TaxID=3346986 RepID=UPI003669228A